MSESVNYKPKVDYIKDALFDQNISSQKKTDWEDDTIFGDDALDVGVTKKQFLERMEEMGYDEKVSKACWNVFNFNSDDKKIDAKEYQKILEVFASEKDENNSEVTVYDMYKYLNEDAVQELKDAIDNYDDLDEYVDPKDRNDWEDASKKDKKKMNSYLDEVQSKLEKSSPNVKEASTQYTKTGQTRLISLKDGSAAVVELERDEEDKNYKIASIAVYDSLKNAKKGQDGDSTVNPNYKFTPVDDNDEKVTAKYNQDASSSESDDETKKVGSGNNSKKQNNKTELLAKEGSISDAMSDLFSKNSKVKVDKKGQYYIKSESWDANNADGLDCTSRILKNIYGETYYTEKGKKILKKLKEANPEFFKNGISIIPDNAKLKLIDATEILGLDSEVKSNDNKVGSSKASISSDDEDFEDKKVNNPKLQNILYAISGLKVENVELGTTSYDKDTTDGEEKLSHILKVDGKTVIVYASKNKDQDDYYIDKICEYDKDKGSVAQEEFEQSNEPVNVYQPLDNGEPIKDPYYDSSANIAKKLKYGKIASKGTKYKKPNINTILKVIQGNNKNDKNKLLSTEDIDDTNSQQRQRIMVINNRIVVVKETLNSNGEYEISTISVYKNKNKISDLEKIKKLINKNKPIDEYCPFVNDSKVIDENA